MIHENLKGVLDNYNIQVLNIKNENYKVKKGVWRIKTSKGNVILKKNSIASDRLNFIIAAIDYLSQRGINIPKIIKSKQGKKYISINDCNYVLTEAIAGVAPSSKNKEGLERIIKELAKFHAASRGFSPPEGCKPNILLDTWYDKSAKKMNKLKGFYEQEKIKSNHSEFENIILKVFPYFYKKMELALSTKNKSMYDRWVNEVSKTPYLVHQDFIDGNLIMTDSNKLFVLDEDSIAIDLPTKDIRKFLNKVMKKRGGWDLQLTKEIISWYQQVNPLEKWQWQVLKNTLMYPHLLAGIMDKYYRKREESWTENKYVKRLEDIISIEKSKEIILDKYQQIIDSLY